MEICFREDGNKINLLKVKCFIAMVIAMRVNLLIVKGMVMEYINMQTRRYTRDIGKIIARRKVNIMLFRID
jgi:hypothetical protein